MKKKLEALEATLDQQLESLPIWQASFQSILSTLLLIIDNVGRSKGADTAMDHCSRLSYLFNRIRDIAANHEVESSASAIMGLADPTTFSSKVIAPIGTWGYQVLKGNLSKEIAAYSRQLQELKEMTCFFIIHQGQLHPTW